MEFLPQAFCALGFYSQFIIYSLVPSQQRPGKLDKFPCDFKTGNIANAHDPNIWTTADNAIKVARSFGSNYGVGFVFTKDDPFWFLDIDNCLQPSGQEWSPLACDLMTRLAGAAVEISASMRGLHIIGSGKIPSHSCKNVEHGLELYSSGRFVALTGTSAIGFAETDLTVPMTAIIDQYFKPTSTPVDQGWTTEPVSAWRGSDDDDEIISRALKSVSARSKFGGNASFRDLWEVNIPVLAASYPAPDKPHGYDESSADAALAQHLAFWTGNNCARMLRLMLKSGLVREKWDRDDYLPRTIISACGRQKDWLLDKPPQINEISDKKQELRSTANYVTGNPFLTPDAQIKHFEGCVYVQDEHKIFTPTGQLLKPDQFKATYGGVTMVMDANNQKTTKNAFEAFTESQVLRHPRAHSSCFRPDLPSGAIITRNNERLVNTYIPLDIEMEEMDLTPFFRHFGIVFPVDRDRDILLAYFAAVVQHKGVKFQWCPLIQGVEGNGKTLFTRLLWYAVGARYCHAPKAAEITSRFNDWLYRKIFAAIEDIYTPDNKLETIEILKPMITSEFQEIEAKGLAKVTREICVNFIINSNHKDGLRKSQNDRRFAVFYMAQQEAAHLKRDGLDGNFFPDYYDWLNNGGYKGVAWLLHNYRIPHELNPATGCKRAPDTSSTAAAITQGLGGIEQEIMEAVDEGHLGFRNGWLSSIMISKLLDKLGVSRRLSPNRRRDLTTNLGYILHPGLPEGRAQSTVLPDGGKPRLYVKAGHYSEKLNPQEILKAYEHDQKA